jgi:hypothetical protein
VRMCFCTLCSHQPKYGYCWFCHCHNHVAEVPEYSSVEFSKLQAALTHSMNLLMESGTQYHQEVSSLEEELRYLMWSTHSHPMKYGDDGEMQCSACLKYGCADYKRAPLHEVRKAYTQAMMEVQFGKKETA